MPALRFGLRDVKSPEAALVELRNLAARGAVSPRVRIAALKIIQDCQGRDDACELQAIFDAIQRGTPYVKGLERGVKYVADPRQLDWFVGAEALMGLCESGACAEDCDGQATIVAALCSSIGYAAGVRAYGSNPGVKAYDHVYAVVGYPKRAPTEVWGMDTTVPRASPGWEPPKGSIVTAWLPTRM